MRKRKIPDRIALDFGTSNTVLAAWNKEEQCAETIAIPGWSREYPEYRQGDDQSPVFVIPSTIHFSRSGEQWIGQQVEDRCLQESPSTVRWMKHYLANMSPVRLTINGKGMSYYQAAETYLQTILAYALEQRDGDATETEIVLTVPVEAFEYYEDWLCSVVEKANITRFRLIDEASAAALAYQVRLSPGDPFMVFDLGGGTLDVSVVVAEQDSSNPAGRRCRVLGKAGADLGGMHIDRWLVCEVMNRVPRQPAGRKETEISRALLHECQAAKELLSFRESVLIGDSRPVPEIHTPIPFSQKDLEELLDKYEFFSRIHSTIQHAMNGAISRGYTEDQLKAVVMVGGSSAIPSVQSTLKRRFGGARVIVDSPLDAVARGAAAFAAGMAFSDHIQHDYAIKFWNGVRSCYEYRTIVKKGTPYPGSGPVARLRIRGSYDGQTQLGIPVYEIGDSTRGSSEDTLELVADPAGSMRVIEVPHREDGGRVHFWMNEKNPTFLTAEPPVVKGETRFEVSFFVDGNKRLLITAKDTRNNSMVTESHPVVRLI